MAYDLNDRSLIPLSEFIASAGEFLLSEYIPASDAPAIFDNLYVVEPFLTADGPNLVLDCHLAFPSEISLSLPGADTWGLVLGSAGPGWSAVHAILTIGPDASLVLNDLTLGLRFDPDVLRNPTTGAGAVIEFTCAVRVTPAGFELTDYAGLTLAESALCGTDIRVAANNVQLVLEGDHPPPFVAHDFRGVAFERLAVTIPADYLDLDPGSTLDIEIADAAIGSTGFTGRTTFHPPAGSQLTGTFAGFRCRLREFALDVVENALVAAGLKTDIRLEALEESGQEKWVAIDVSFGQGGGFSAEASAIQPAASSDPAMLVTVEYQDAVKLGLNALRVTKTSNGLWAVYFSGYLQMLIEGAAWPKIGFDELGVSSDGELLLPEGSGITFDSPLVVEWYYVRLTVPKFRFGRPQGSQVELQIQLSAEVELLEGLPSGASVEGLTVTWNPKTGDAPDVRFAGIGVELSVPGCFSAGIQLGFTQDGGSVEFRGQGHLELSALDMAIQIGVIVGYDQPQDFAYLYLFADAKLLPTGIPIGQSGLAIFGFQGLIAFNMALDLDKTSPVDERYYKLFVKRPIGITDISKWRKDKGQNALGIGILFGTVDKGFAFNVKGLLAVAFPDLVLLLQSKSNFLKLKPDLETESEGTLDTLLVFDSRENTFTFDIVAHWGMPSIVEVNGSARAFFDFDDPAAFYLEIGRDADGKRVTANAIRWGNGWLFSAGFWFRLNRSGVVTGVLIEVGVRYDSGGFWIEAAGRARGEMKLFWEPPQWEGSIALEGRIGAGYRGISVGISLGGAARVCVANPLLIELHAEACFKALFWHVCQGHTFRWARPDPPQLERPIRAISASPRDWTLNVEDAPPPGAAGQAKADDGTVQLLEGTTTRNVQPHSSISIAFAKPMTDATGKFNEWVPLPGDGYITVGSSSGYAARYQLKSVHLVRDPDGAREDVDLWGTWALETSNYNTVLRLMSSSRFGHDGTLTESFGDGVKLDYCARPANGQTCVSLAGIEPGFGWIDGTFPYFWDVARSKTPLADRRNTPFVELLSGDRLSVYLPVWVTKAQFVTRDCPPREDEPKGLMQQMSAWLRDRLPNFQLASAEESFALAVGGDLKPVTIRPEKRECVEKLCYDPVQSPIEYVTETRRGGSITKRDDWTVAPDDRLLAPGSKYELTVELQNDLRGPRGRSQAASWKTTFTVDAPPAYPNALADYVGATYPAAGGRPVYTGYDILVRFKHDYVPQLYKSVHQQLCIRLYDGQGNPVTDTHGNPILLPVSRMGMPDRSVSDRYWERQYKLNVARGCIAEDLSYREGETTIALPGPSIVLTPSSQYRATLVSDANPGTALHAWDFTTSSFATFTALATSRRAVLRPRPVMRPPAGADFESIARSLDVPTVSYVSGMTVTPFVTADRVSCPILLLEAPEPFEAALRLKASVDGIPARIVENVDGTRLFLQPPANATWPAGDHVLRLTWSRGTAADPAELRRAVDGVLGTETVEITVSSGGI